jgi:uncharacterized membrane protein YfcA
MAAAFAGAVVGVFGGLIGLGGAEFRLPLLVGFFADPLRVVGALIGAMLVAFAPGSFLKALLGRVLIVSAARLRAHAPAAGK